MSGRNMSRGNVLPHVKREEELSGSGDVRGEHVREEYVQGECPTPCKKGGGIVREWTCPGEHVREEYVQGKCPDPTDRRTVCTQNAIQPTAVGRSGRHF